MASLQILPTEVLGMIADAISPPVLRRDVGTLVICRQWYRAALPVYLRDLRLENIYLSANSLERFPPSSGLLYQLICKRLKRLSIRLLGHPSWQIAYEPFVVPVFQRHHFIYDDCVHKEKCRWACSCNKEDDRSLPWAEVGMSRDQSTFTLAWSSTMEHILLPWGKRISQCLRSLSEHFSMFEALEEISFEASTEPHVLNGPRWNYLAFGTIVQLVSAIPKRVASLTLDLNGVESPTPWAGSDETHLCAFLAPRLHDFENVRLRLRHICPSIFSVMACYDDTPVPNRWLALDPKAGSADPPSDESSPAESSSDHSISKAPDSTEPSSRLLFDETKWHLSSLIIKLSLPISPPHCHTPWSDSEWYPLHSENSLAGLCPESVSIQAGGAEIPLKDYMGQAASKFARSVPNLGECIISQTEQFVDQEYPQNPGFIRKSIEYVGKNWLTMEHWKSGMDGGRRWQSWEYEVARWGFPPISVCATSHK